MTHRGCDPTTNSTLDNCNFIWKDYHKSGYITLFAEDQKEFAAFNNRHKGFIRKPTDHYFRPFILAAEKILEVKKKDRISMCLGRSIYLDHIFIYLQKMLVIHKLDPSFAFAIINSLNDKQLSSSPIFDNRINSQFLSNFVDDTANDTIFIIFSDKGTRFENNEVSFKCNLNQGRVKYREARLQILFCSVFLRS
jgi:hypothetical protein